jgi:monoamine oxidase
MARPRAEQIVVIGAGFAGMMAARELGRGGKRVTILEAETDAAAASIRFRQRSSDTPRKVAPNSSTARRRSRAAREICKRAAGLLVTPTRITDP